jgi:hypothetical protein
VVYGAPHPPRIARGSLTDRFRERSGELLVVAEAVDRGHVCSVEPFHLFRYLDEQAYRYNNRKEAMDFETAASQIVGKRLTWKQLAGIQDEGSWSN